MNPTKSAIAMLIGSLSVQVLAQEPPAPAAATPSTPALPAAPTPPTPPTPAAPPPAPTHATPRDDGIVPLAHVEKRGTGPVAMVLIPEAGCDWSVFDTFIERNKDRYTMYAVNLPGFGGSLPPPPKKQLGEWVDNAARAVWAYIAENKIEKPVIVGHSLGGQIAMKVGVAHSDALRAIVVIDGVPTFPVKDGEGAPERAARAARLRESLEKATDDEWDAMQLRNSAQWVAMPDRANIIGEMLILHPRPATIGYMEDMLSVDLRDDLPSLKARTLVIAALAPGMPADKAPASKKQISDLFAKAPTAKIVYFDNSRHFVHEDQPAAVDAAVERFIKGEEVEDFHGPAPVVPPRKKMPPPVPPPLNPAEPATNPPSQPPAAPPK